MKTQRVFGISILFFIVLLFVVPPSLVPAELGNVILTVTAFLFGIIAGFYIVVTTTDYNSLKNTLAAETAGWITIYNHLKVYDIPSAQRIRPLIDAYIRGNFDAEIIEYTNVTQDEFRLVEDAIQALPLKLEMSWLYQKIRDVMAGIVLTRQQLTVLGARTLSPFQWAVLGIVGGLFVACLYGLRTGEFFFDIVAVAISSSLVLVFMLIRDLDLYIWNEQTFSFDVFQNVFHALGELPYYPLETLDQGRVNPKEKSYRVGVYEGVGDKRKVEIRGAVVS